MSRLHCLSNLLFCLFVAALLNACGKSRERGLGPGDLAPDFVARALDGKEVRLSDFRGKVVLLNIWASWCGTCVAEMPELERLYSLLKEQGFVVLGAGLEDTPDNFAEAKNRLGLTFPITVDPTNAIKQIYRVWGYPESFIIDREGRIRKFVDVDGKTPTVRFVGPREWSDPTLVKQFRRLLSE